MSKGAIYPIYYLNKWFLYFPKNPISVKSPEFRKLSFAM